MRRSSLLYGALLGAGSSIVLMLVAYWGNRLAGLPSVTFDLFDWLARVLPGFVVNFGIDLMVRIITGLHLGPTASTAKLAEASIGVAQFLALGIVFGVVLVLLRRGNPAGEPLYGVLVGSALFIALAWIKSVLGFGPAGAVVDLAWLAILFLGWGRSLDMLLAVRAAPRPAGEAAAGVSRRRFIYASGSAVLAAALGIVAGVAYLRRPPTRLASGPTTSTALGPTNGPAASPPLAVLNARILPAPGTRLEYTPTSNFYRIDINIFPPSIDPRTWRLQVVGMVDRVLDLSLDDVRSRPAISQAITLSCISNPLGGDLISTSRLTGVPVRAILSEAGVQKGATFLNMTSADGFYESLAVSTAMEDERILLVYDMDGAPLPAEHGFPLRIYIPDLYGMKQPKWLTRIKLANFDGSGYWVDRGWSKTAAVKPTSVIDAISAANPDRTVSTAPAGGIAYAGARGISKVEVQMDDGPWLEAELRTPPLSPLTWVQWRFDFPYKAGAHTFRVRAYDGRGVLQVLGSSDAYPDGATGVYSRVAVL